MPIDESAHTRRYVEAIHAARLEGDAEFQSWFNTSSSVEESVRRGYWDFAVHVLTPAVVARIEDPGRLTALEIGYGGGRLLAAAATYFGKAIGVDVHGEAEAVAAFLARDNVELLDTDGAHIPVEDESVDLVYSFIVLQHLPSIDAFARYIRETARVLRPGGTAQLYYSRLRSRNPMRMYREIPDAHVNHISLEVRPRYVAKLARTSGLQVAGRGASYKRAPDGYPGTRGGQAHVTLAKARRPGGA